MISIFFFLKKKFSRKSLIFPCLCVVISVRAFSAVVGEDVTHEVENSQQYNHSPIARPGFHHTFQTPKYKQQTSLQQVCTGISLHATGCEILTTSIVRMIGLTVLNIKSHCSLPSGSSIYFNIDDGLYRY